MRGVEKFHFLLNPGGKEYVAALSYPSSKIFNMV